MVNNVVNDRRLNMVTRLHDKDFSRWLRELMIWVFDLGCSGLTMVHNCHDCNMGASIYPALGLSPSPINWEYEPTSQKSATPCCSVLLLCLALDGPGSPYVTRLVSGADRIAGTHRQRWTQLMPRGTAVMRGASSCDMGWSSSWYVYQWPSGRPGNGRPLIDGETVWGQQSSTCSQRVASTQVD